MKVLDNIVLSSQGYPNIRFIRIDPEDVSVTIRDIIEHLQNLSWINNFDQSYVRGSFLQRSARTVDFLKKKLEKKFTDRITKEIGETVISELSRSTLINTIGYADIPLAELIKQQISGNPGFDFFSETTGKMIIFGEAKYLSGKNAYGNAMEQVDRFIREGRDISDLNDIDRFVSSNSLNNAMNGKKAYACGFSSTSIFTVDLINNIIRNRYFAGLSKYQEFIFIAINI